MKYIKLFEEFDTLNENMVVDREFDNRTREYQDTNRPLFNSDKEYTIPQFIKIAKGSAEGKRAYKGTSNFGKSIKLAERLRKELPKQKFEVRVSRSAWNYGNNIVVSIKLGGKKYGTDVFKFNSAASTSQPNYSFSELFNGTIKPSESRPETEWGMGIIHGSFQSISQFDKFVSDVIGVFNDFERVNGKPFDIKNALAEFKKLDKIRADWKRVEPRIDKIYYNEAKPNAQRLGIEVKAPRLKVNDKVVRYFTNEPRDLRHPDEYGEYAEKRLNSKEYIKYEKAQSKIADLIQKFCNKHELDFNWSA